MTFYEQTFITVLKVMVFTNLVGFAILLFCFINILEPKQPKQPTDAAIRWKEGK